MKSRSSLADAKVNIGGKSKFVPNINASKWNDEAWLNVNHSASIVTNQKEKFVDRKIELNVGNLTHKYYVDANGHLEYEIVFSQKPPTNKIEFALDFPEGLGFFYQDTLENNYLRCNAGYKSFDEYSQHFHMPENVVGSYAVYWNKKNNEYKTGKFCHIYRPKLIDALNNQKWAELYIDSIAKTLIIRFDSIWMANAAYPVTLDPNLGYDTPGGSSYGDPNGSYSLQDASDATGGNVQNFHVSIAAIHGTHNGYKMALYADTGSDEPGVLMEQIQFNASVSDDKITASVDKDLLAASTKYWVAQIPEDADTTTKYDYSTCDLAKTLGNAYATQFYNPAQNIGASTACMSIWVDYLPPAANAPTGGLYGSLVGPFGGPMGPMGGKL